MKKRLAISAAWVLGAAGVAVAGRALLMWGTACSVSTAMGLVTGFFFLLGILYLVVSAVCALTGWIDWLRRG